MGGRTLPTLVYRAFCPEWGLATVQAFSPFGLCNAQAPCRASLCSLVPPAFGFLGPSLCLWPSVQTACIVCETPEGHCRHSHPFVCSIQSDMKGGDVKNPFQTRAGKHTHDLYAEYGYKTWQGYTHGKPKWKEASAILSGRAKRRRKEWPVLSAGLS